MKLSVCISDDLLAVPCKGNETVNWLCEEAIIRYNKITVSHADKKLEFGKLIEVRKSKGGARLDLDDQINTVLDDNECVAIGKSKF